MLDGAKRIEEERFFSRGYLIFEKYHKMLACLLPLREKAKRVKTASIRKEDLLVLEERALDGWIKLFLAASLKFLPRGLQLGKMRNLTRMTWPVY